MNKKVFNRDVLFDWFVCVHWPEVAVAQIGRHEERETRTVVAVAVAVRWRGEWHCFVLLHQASAQHPANTRPRKNGVHEEL